MAIEDHKIWREVWKVWDKSNPNNKKLYQFLRSKAGIRPQALQAYCLEIEMKYQHIL